MVAGRVAAHAAAIGRGVPDTGPGIIETSLVIGLAGLLAVAILVFFGGGVADVIGQVVDAAHGGR